MKALVGLFLVLCLALAGCADDETTPADGGADAVADVSVVEDVEVGETAPEEAGVSETSPGDAAEEASLPEDGGAE